MQTDAQLVHLLYVPTIYCNLGCSYCYLGKQTDQGFSKSEFEKIQNTLEFGVSKFKESGYTPFNISLHGGEVTTLPAKVLEKLFSFISDYYKENDIELKKSGFNKTSPHIKTNLYNFDKHYNLMNEHKVSISASVDLPLSLHEKYRVTKKGSSTLSKTLANVKLLANYPHRKKMSAVFYQEHIDKTDEIIHDIWFLHKEVGINMNHFNFMFGFESSLNDQKFQSDSQLSTIAVSDQTQVDFYRTMKKAFAGTELNEGLEKHWFDEFMPSYCTSAFNCGEKFFLMQSDGDIYSCVRGQGTPAFYYGNIFKNSITEIMTAGAAKISKTHRTHGLHEDCQQCEYLAICHSGCAFVKNEQNKGKSYTCALQKEIYRDFPEKYPATNKVKQQKVLNEYIIDMHPYLVDKKATPVIHNELLLPNDLYDPQNTLSELIRIDQNLRALYSNDIFSIIINNKEIQLTSQILKSTRSIFSLNSNDSVILKVKVSVFEYACHEKIRNTLHLQLLRDTYVTYGEEKRHKQEHCYTHETFFNHLKATSDHKNEYIEYDLMPFLLLAQPSYLPKVINNLFITTSYLRRYHYDKQKNNAFYHIQAVNLPFPNFEFYWNDA